MLSSANKSTAAKTVLKSLPSQQRKFVEAFCLSLNGAKAAITAGYSAKTARIQASQLLTKLNIKQAIQELLVHAGADPEEIAARWDRLARADLSDFYTREQVEHRPKIEKKLSDIVAEYRQEIEFEQEVALRTEALITDRKKRERYRKDQAEQQLARERKLLRMEIELEHSPKATRFVSGPTVLRDEMRLDLAKADSLGLLDLVKSVTNSRNGASFSLRDADAALDKLAQWRGMLTTKIDLTSKGEAVAAPSLLGVLTLEQKKEILEAKRRAQKGAVDAQ